MDVVIALAVVNLLVAAVITVWTAAGWRRYNRHRLLIVLLEIELWIRDELKRQSKSNNIKYIMTFENKKAIWCLEWIESAPLTLDYIPLLVSWSLFSEYTKSHSSYVDPQPTHPTPLPAIIILLYSCWTVLPDPPAKPLYSAFSMVFCLTCFNSLW